MFRLNIWKITFLIFGLSFPIVIGETISIENVAARDLSTAVVERGNIDTIVTAAGTIDAKVKVDVGSQLSGQVAEVLADFNDPVSAGQPLARLHQEDLRARVRQAEADLAMANGDVAVKAAALEQAGARLARARAMVTEVSAQRTALAAELEEAERTLGRKRRLLRKGAAAESTIDQATTRQRTAAGALHAAEARTSSAAADVAFAEASMRLAEGNLAIASSVVRQKQAALDQAVVDLQRATIRSPIDGMVIHRNVESGQVVTSSFQSPVLFTIAQDLREMKVDAFVNEADIGLFRVGQSARFSVAAYPDRAFHGHVLEIRRVPTVIQNVVTYPVVISAPNPDMALLPGMTAEVNTVVAARRNVIKVPNIALGDALPVPSASAGKAWTTPESAAASVRSVLVMAASGIVNEVSVQTGITDGVMTEILPGQIKEGQVLVIPSSAPAGSL
jgi:HlyD family secretion protein